MWRPDSPLRLHPRQYITLNGPVQLRARWCAHWTCRLHGFVGRSRRALRTPLLFVLPEASRTEAAIHMLGVGFPLGVVWLAPDGTVVDLVLARPWRLHYAPRAPARYVLEGAPALLDMIQIGDRLTLQLEDDSCG